MLNPDNDAARAAGTDPHQQLHEHIVTHPAEAFNLGYQCGWLIDMLWFDSIAEPKRWRANIAALVDYVLL